MNKNNGQLRQNWKNILDNKPIKKIPPIE